MNGKIVDFFKRDFFERDLENFTRFSPLIHGIDDDDDFRSGLAQSNCKENFADARADVVEANIFRDAVMIIQKIDDFGSESVISEKHVPASGYEDFFSTVTRKLFHF